MDRNIYTLEELNNLEEFHGSVQIPWEEMPPFFEDVISNPWLSDEDLKYFGEKFFLYWYLNKSVRKLVKDKLILFLDYKYAGIFNTIQDCLNFAHKKNVKGINTHITPITPIIVPEYNETMYSVGQYSVIETLKGDEELTIDRPLFEIECKTVINNIEIQKEIYIPDTGCSITHLGNVDDWDFGEEKYDIDKNPDLKRLNDDVIYKNNIKTQGIGGIIHTKVQVIYSDKTEFHIGRNIILNGQKFTVPKAIFETDIKSLFDFGKTQKRKYIKPHIDKNKLLGISSLSKLKLTMLPISENITKLTLENYNPDINNISLNITDNVLDIHGLQVNFYITILKSNLKLYEKYIDDNIYRPLIFSLLKDAHLFNNEIDFICKKYVITRPLHLIVIFNCNEKMFNEYKDKIMDNSNIDGIIFPNIIRPFNLRIWIKNTDYLNHVSNYEYTSDDFINEDDYNKLLDKEKEIIDNNKICQYTIKKNDI